MNKKTLLFLWAFVSYIAFAIAIPWYLLYETTVLRPLGIFGTISCITCIITFAIIADKQAILSFFQGKISLSTSKTLILHLAGKITLSFFESTKKREINRALIIACCTISMIVTIPFVIIIVSTITLCILNGIYYLYTHIWGWVGSTNLIFHIISTIISSATKIP